jgi:hypothetical protein
MASRDKAERLASGANHFYIGRRLRPRLDNKTYTRLTRAFCERLCISRGVLDVMHMDPAIAFWTVSLTPIFKNVLNKLRARHEQWAMACRIHKTLKSSIICFTM